MSLIVTKLAFDDTGALNARVTVDGGTVPVTRRSGSWTTVPDENGRCRELLPWVAGELQKRARPLERRAST